MQNINGKKLQLLSLSGAECFPKTLTGGLSTLPADQKGLILSAILEELRDMWSTELFPQVLRLWSILTLVKLLAWAKKYIVKKGNSLSMEQNNSVLKY